MKKNVSIPFSKKKVVSEFWKIVTVTCFMIFITLLSIKSKSQNVLLDSIGILVSSILLYALFLYVKVLRGNSPGLVINPHGITYNFPGTSRGTIPWSAIEKIRKKQVLNDQFLAVRVQDPEKHALQRGLFSRILYNIIPSQFDEPMYISPDVLDVSFEELVEIIDKYYKEFVNA